jgi:hypothetical protein
MVLGSLAFIGGFSLPGSREQEIVRKGAPSVSIAVGPKVAGIDRGRQCSLDAARHSSGRARARGWLAAKCYSHIGTATRPSQAHGSWPIAPVR